MLFYSEAGRCKDVYAHASRAQSSAGESDQVVRLSVADTEVFGRGESGVVSAGQAKGGDRH